MFPDATFQMEFGIVPTGSDKADLYFYQARKTRPTAEPADFNIFQLIDHNKPHFISLDTNFGVTDEQGIDVPFYVVEKLCHIQQLQSVIDSGKPYGLPVNSRTLGAKLSRFQPLDNLQVAALSCSSNNFLEHGDIRFITRAQITLVADIKVGLLVGDHNLQINKPINGRVASNGIDAVLEILEDIQK